MASSGAKHKELIYQELKHYNLVAGIREHPEMNMEKIGLLFVVRVLMSGPRSKKAVNHLEPMSMQRFIPLKIIFHSYSWGRCYFNWNSLGEFLCLEDDKPIEIGHVF